MSAAPVLLEALVSLLILAGAFFTLAGSIGLVRFPDFFLVGAPRCGTSRSFSAAGSGGGAGSTNAATTAQTHSTGRRTSR